MRIAIDTKMGMSQVEHHLGKEVLNRPVNLQSEMIQLEYDLVVDKLEAWGSSLACRNCLKPWNWSELSQW